MDDTSGDLAYRMERDQLYYRERAVDHALELLKQNGQNASVETLVTNANVILNFYKGNSNE